MLTKKSKKLTLILFYSEYSMAFLKAQSVLKKLIEDLGPIGKLYTYTYLYDVTNNEILFEKKKIFVFYRC